MSSKINFFKHHVNVYNSVMQNQKMGQLYVAFTLLHLTFYTTSAEEAVKNKYMFENIFFNFKYFK